MATQLQMDQSPSNPLLRLSNCSVKALPPRVSITYASSALFDSTVVLLVTYKLAASYRKSGIGRQVHVDNLIYFIVVTTANIVIFVTQLLPASMHFVKVIAMPFSTLLTSTLSQRVYLNLKLFNTIDPQTSQPKLEEALDPGLATTTNNAPLSTHIGFPTEVTSVYDHQSLCTSRRDPSKTELNTC